MTTVTVIPNLGFLLSGANAFGSACMNNGTCTPKSNKPKPQGTNVCNTPLTAPANRGQTVSSRRAQVRAEVRGAFAISIPLGSLAVLTAYNFQLARNFDRVRPGGSWIRGQASTAEGNRLYGAITAELGASLSVAISFADSAEQIHDWFTNYADMTHGGDSEVARRQITQGRGC